MKGSRPSGEPHPYPPGWVDRLGEWIDRMPGPNLLYCVALLLLEVLYVSVVLWIGGRVAVGSFDGRPMFVAVVAPYFLWIRFHLDRVASRALDAFRPALSADDAEVSRLRYELTTLSARTTRIVTAVAAIGF